VQISPDCGPCFRRRCEKGLCNSLDIRRILDKIDGQLNRTSDRACPIKNNFI
jgi:hypothetical protein